jgi:hypothetical protein
LEQHNGQEHSFFQKLQEQYGSVGKLTPKASAAMAAALAGPERPSFMPPTQDSIPPVTGDINRAALSGTEVVLVPSSSRNQVFFAQQDASLAIAAAVSPSGNDEAALSKSKSKKKKKRDVTDQLSADSSASTHAAVVPAETNADEVRWNALLRLFCTQNCPQHMSLVPATLKQFNGQERELMRCFSRISIVLLHFVLFCFLPNSLGLYIYIYIYIYICMYVCICIYILVYIGYLPAGF